MCNFFQPIAHLVEVPGRLYEFEPGRRELKSPRLEIGRGIVAVSAGGSISALSTGNFYDSVV